MHEANKITYYHVGRDCRLGSTARCVTLSQVPLGPFPGGLSRHGEQYVVRGHHPGNREMASFESLIEEIWSGHYPQRPSRFISLFACRTLENARKFGKKYCGESVACFDIRKIECENASVHDMDWLSARHRTIEDRTRDIHRYWKGLATRTPIWEVLIPLPIWVGPSIETYNRQGRRWIVTKTENE